VVWPVNKKIAGVFTAYQIVFIQDRILRLEKSVRFANHERGVRKDDKKRDLCKEIWINHDIRLLLEWGGSSQNHSFEIRQFFPHFPGEFNVFLTEFIAVVCMDFADGVLHLL
jgi:hypothetical protein